MGNSCKITSSTEWRWVTRFLTGKGEEQVPEAWQIDSLIDSIFDVGKLIKFLAKSLKRQ
jgi:hypothetical protein